MRTIDITTDGTTETYPACEAEKIGLIACDHYVYADTHTRAGEHIGLCDVHTQMALRGINDGDTWTYYTVRGHW